MWAPCRPACGPALCCRPPQRHAPPAGVSTSAAAGCLQMHIVLQPLQIAISTSRRGSEIIAAMRRRAAEHLALLLAAAIVVGAADEHKPDLQVEWGAQRETWQWDAHQFLECGLQSTPRPSQKRVRSVWSLLDAAFARLRLRARFPPPPPPPLLARPGCSRHQTAARVPPFTITSCRSCTAMISTPSWTLPTRALAQTVATWHGARPRALAGRRASPLP